MVQNTFFSVLETNIDFLQIAFFFFFFQTSDSRKKLIDEMAITIQKKTAESEESVDNLNKEIALFKANLQELDVEKKELLETVEKLESKETGLKDRIKELESSEAELEMVVDQTKTQTKREIENVKESLQDELRIQKDEHDFKMRDLNMQLEIGTHLLLFLILIWIELKYLYLISLILDTFQLMLKRMNLKNQLIN